MTSLVGAAVALSAPMRKSNERVSQEPSPYLPRVNCFPKDVVHDGEFASLHFEPQANGQQGVPRLDHVRRRVNLCQIFTTLLVRASFREVAYLFSA